MEKDEISSHDGVVVMTQGPIISCATVEQMHNMEIPLKDLLQGIVKDAVEYAKKILPDYDYPNGNFT